MNEYKLGSLFSGIGGFELVGSWYGFEPVWASEIEPAPIRITKRHFPNMKHVGDITKLNGHTLEPVDIITGGSPCTDISVAGKQCGIKLICPSCGNSVSANTGIKTCANCGMSLELTRSGLFVEQIRVIKEMLEETNYEYPKIIVWENVSTAISSNNGDDFYCVLQEFCGLISERLPTLRPEKWTKSGEILGKSGSIAWRTFDAQYWGVPQRRRRIFLVADLRGQCAGKILFEQERMRRNYSKSEKTWERTSTKIETCIGLSDSGKQKQKTSKLNLNQGYQPYAATFKYQQAAAMATLPYDEYMSSTLTSHQNIAVLINNHTNTFKETDGFATLACSDRCVHNNSEYHTIVRRLTPVECERLQGFPDNWTAGESDNARYKALGNSVALPCVDYIMNGIANVFYNE